MLEKESGAGNYSSPFWRYTLAANSHMTSDVMFWRSNFDLDNKRCFWDIFYSFFKLQFVSNFPFVMSWCGNVELFRWKNSEPFLHFPDRTYPENFIRIAATQGVFHTQRRIFTKTLNAMTSKFDFCIRKSRYKFYNGK